MLCAIASISLIFSAAVASIECSDSIDAEDDADPGLDMVFDAGC